MIVAIPPSLKWKMQPNSQHMSHHLISPHALKERKVSHIVKLDEQPYRTERVYHPPDHRNLETIDPDEEYGHSFNECSHEQGLQSLEVIWLGVLLDVGFDLL